MPEPNVPSTAVGIGRQAEDLAAEYLQHRGYRVLARNHRCHGGEVDLVAWDAGILCFIEVRARRTLVFGDPLETIDRRKIRRVVRASANFLDSSWSGPWPPMRFDALGIVLADPPVFTLVRAAFET